MIILLLYLGYLLLWGLLCKGVTNGRSSNFYLYTILCYSFGTVHRKSKKRKKEKESEGPLRVRSISELARLVSSGAIRVPKSLINYADDRTQLMDQVFTILSPDDIKGMLPDILKVYVYSFVVILYSVCLICHRFSMPSP